MNRIRNQSDVLFDILTQQRYGPRFSADLATDLTKHRFRRSSNRRRPTQLAAILVALVWFFPAESAAQSTNLIVNGSFEEPTVPSGTFRVFSSLPGWTQFIGSPGEVLPIL